MTTDRARPDARPAHPALHAQWRTRYQRLLWMSDLIALVWVVFGTQIAWFGLGDARLVLAADGTYGGISYWVFSAALVVLWMWALALSESRSHRIIGVGSTEYLRVTDASFRLFGLIAIVAFLGQFAIARGFLLISLPMGIAVLLLERWLWRQWLIAKRASGDYSARVLLVGSRASVAQIATELARTPTAGYVVVGACVPEGKADETVGPTRVPVVGTVDAVEPALRLTGADTVAVTGTDELPPDKVKQISWGLEAGRQHLVLAPSIIDIAARDCTPGPWRGSPSSTSRRRGSPAGSDS